MKPRAEDGAPDHGPAHEKPESDWGLAPPKRRSSWETKFAIVVILGLLGGFGWLCYQKVLARQLAEKNGDTTEQSDGANGDPNTVEGALAAGEPTLSATEDDPFVSPAAEAQRMAQAEPDFSDDREFRGQEPTPEAENPFAADDSAVANARQKVARAEETLLEANQELANDEFAQNRDAALAQQAKQRIAQTEGNLLESQQELANDEFALNEDRAITQQAKQKVAQAQTELAEAQQELTNDEFALNEDKAADRQTLPRQAETVPVTGDLEDTFEADADARAAIVPESVETLPAAKSRVAELAEEVETGAARAGRAVEKAIERAPEKAVEAVESLFGGEPAVVNPAPTRAAIREERAVIRQEQAQVREERAQIRQQERARIEAEEDRFGGYEPIPEGNRSAESRIEIVRPEPHRLTIVERAEKGIGRAVNAAETGIRNAETGIRNEIRAIEGKPPVANSVTTVERPIAEPVIVPRSAPVVSGREPAAIDVNEFEAEEAPRRTGIRQTGVAAENALEALEARAGGAYVVQPNDNYWKISRKVYGTGRYYNALARHNQQRVPDPKQMRPGMKISTPAKEQLERHYADLLRNSASAPENQGPTGFFVNKAGHPMYRIGSEDTLSGIAQNCLGRSSRYTEILELNRDRLRNADDLKIGLELRLPADASQARIVNSPRDRF